MKLGTRVKSLRDFHSVKKGTEGYVVEDYGTGITIAWDLPDKPYPKHMTPQEIGDMWSIDPKCPIRDGFDKMTELDFLTIYEE